MDKKASQRFVGAVILILLAAAILILVFRNDNINLSKLRAVESVPNSPYNSQISQQVKTVAKKIAEEKNVIIKKRLAKPKHWAFSYPPSLSQKQLTNKSTLNLSQIKKKWYVQVATFSNRAYAQRLQKKLIYDKEKTKIITIADKNDKISYYQVVIGPLDNKRSAQKTLNMVEKSLKLKGLILYSSERVKI